MSTGENIRRLRESRGWFQKDLAEASNIYQAKISRIENGKMRVIKPEVLQKIADALGVSVEKLVDSPKGVDYVVNTPEGPVAVEIKTTSPVREYDFESFISDFLSLDPYARGLVVDFVRTAKERALPGQADSSENPNNGGPE